MEDKSLIGKKVRGFKFESRMCNLYFNEEMNNYIGDIGVVTDIRANGRIWVLFEDGKEWIYPAELIYQHLVEDTPQHYDNSNGIFEITKDTVVQQVMNDLNERSLKGIDKYNNTLEREDLELSDWLQHAYEETLDKANYLKRAILKLNESNLN